MHADRQPLPATLETIPPSAPLSPSMIHDLPVITQFEQHAAQSIVAPKDTPEGAQERSRSTHSSRRRRKTRVRARDGGEESVFQPGSRLVDRYEVLRKLGQGGMSLVYEAFDEIRNEPVALKVLLPSLAVSSKMQQRFLQEGRIASNFSHPNIARVYDLHQTDSLIMLSMELLHGSTLRHDMDRRKTQRQSYRPHEVLTAIQQISHALEVVHASGVIHRDLKPENLWMGLDETIKMMDFGIARDSMKTAYTTGPRGSGTPYYIAPEQLSASPSLDHRADQYSLGVIAYEMLTGSIPQGVIHPPHEVNPEVPRQLSMAVFRAINSDPDKRFPSTKAFADACRYQKGPSIWRRIAMLTGGMGLVAGSAFGIQYGLMPLLETKLSPVWATVPLQQVTENDEISFVVRHPESTLTGSELSFKLLADAPDGAKIDASSGRFAWKPNESQGPQEYSFKIMAIVKQPGMAPIVEEQPFNISVAEHFDEPRMDTPNAFVLKEHEVWKVQLDAKDINVPTVGLRYELLEGPPGMSIDNRTGVLQWKPQENDGGTNLAPIVRISLNHDAHLDAAIVRKLSLRVDESIDPPSFTSPNRLQAAVGEPIQFRFTARDPNTPEINRYYRLRNGDRFGMSVDPQTGELYWTPTEEQAGKEFELTAEIGWDGAGKSETLAEQTIKVSIDALKEAADKKDTAKTPEPPAATTPVPTLPSPPPPFPPASTCPSGPTGNNGSGTNGGNSSGGTCPNAGNGVNPNVGNGVIPPPIRNPLPLPIPTLPWPNPVRTTPPSAGSNHNNHPNPGNSNAGKPNNGNQGMKWEDAVKQKLQNELIKGLQRIR